MGRCKDCKFYRERSGCKKGFSMTYAGSRGCLTGFKRKWWKRINWLLIAIMVGSVLFYICIGYGVRYVLNPPSIAPESKTQSPMPTFTEIQERLVEKGYDIGTDGVDGRIGPNTLRGWSDAICDQQASRMFRKMSGE